MNPNVKVLQPSGILDGIQAAQLRQEIRELLADGSESVIIDFKEVTFMDSSGLGALVTCLKTIRDAGAELFLCSINDQIRMIFELTSLDRVFSVFSSREEIEQQLFIH